MLDSMLGDTEEEGVPFPVKETRPMKRWTVQENMLNARLYEPD